MRKFNKYHKQFLEMRMSENVAGIFSRYKRAAKEITESMAMVAAAKAAVTGSLADYKVFVIGDGASPRTGALFAYMTRADVVSVDPQMNMDHWQDHSEKQTALGYPVQRLKVLKCKVEDLSDTDKECNGAPIIVAWPHSHASMLAFNPTNFKHRIDIAMPCCYKPPTTLMRIPHTCYQDTDVLSDKNIIHIWKSEGGI